MGKFCIPHEEMMHVIREAHSSRIVGHFRVGKTLAQLQRDCYWTQLQEIVSKYITGCVMCANNIKLGLSTPLPVPSHPC